ncbi:sarcosine oxidase subunit gamma [Pannonibacter phragmitetus]|uniref:sarcosine oxidase subunit gamma n=1 Tax=Pannonibacter phragmitetus TaxID=121719 RepID=UPI000F4568A6|nr:sarcosine oxidase subunit gamma family protein [Pannonibacter phragmitetus]
MAEIYTPAAGETPVLRYEGLSVSRCAPLARLSFRGRAPAQEAIAAALGTALPQTPLTAAASGSRAALWLGPDEWLLLAPEAELDTFQAAADSAVSGLAASVTDISHRQDAVLVSGAKAVWLLNTGVFLDLSLAAFPVGMVTRTLCHKAEVVLWRIAEDSFVLESWRSFLPYVLEHMEDAALELGAKAAV